MVQVLRNFEGKEHILQAKEEIESLRSSHMSFRSYFFFYFSFLVDLSWIVWSLIFMVI